MTRSATMTSMKRTLTLPTLAIAAALTLTGCDALRVSAPTATPRQITPTQIAEPPTTAPTETETPAAPEAEPLAPTVEQSLKTQWGVEEFTQGLTNPDKDPTLLNWYITNIEDGSPGIINVTVQVTADQTDTTEAKRLATTILNLTGNDHPALNWVVVQTADGKITQQTSRAEAPFVD